MIWGPGDPRPTLPIAGWNPGTGAWPKPPAPTEPPDGFSVSPDHRPTPIAEPPWGWGNPPPNPDVPRAAVATQIWLDRSDRMVRVCGAERPGADAVEKEVAQPREAAMIESVSCLLIYICVLALVVYLIIWVLGVIGVALPEKVVQIIWVIVVLIVILMILRVVLPQMGGRLTLPVPLLIS